MSIWCPVQWTTSRPYLDTDYEDGSITTYMPIQRKEEETLRFRRPIVEQCLLLHVFTKTKGCK